MKIVTAPDQYKIQDSDICCFLAGGISLCKEWQKEVIDHLIKLNLRHKMHNLVIFNPRRKDFSMDDSYAEDEQIEWEFEYLNKMDIFSMYFCKSDSDQPICLYELGRYLEVMMNNYLEDHLLDRIIISVESGYKRERDVILQTNLALEKRASKLMDLSYLRLYNVLSSPEKHAKEIVECYESIVYR